MIRWRVGTIVAVESAREGLVRVRVQTERDQLPAIAYPTITGSPVVGERVWLNTTALDLGLGTGGVAIVGARLDAGDIDLAGDGHIVKARYTPSQVTVSSADEQGSAHYDRLAEADDIDGMPVVVADLHSSLPAIVAGIRASRPDLRIGYVMTDGAALPIALSDTVAALSAAGWVSTTVTAGQAFGGELEAVTVHTALLAARLIARVDIAVVCQGPGNLGTGTRWGFSGVAVGEAVNAVSVLGGRAIAALRVSAVDPRSRHRGLSHHTLTALGRVALRPADVVVPLLNGDDAELYRVIRSAAEVLSPPHHIVEISVDGLDDALDRSPVNLSTMGRDRDADPAAFLAAAAAGRHAASLV